MFTARFFPPRYFAANYWAEIGGAPPPGVRTRLSMGIGI